MGERLEPRRSNPLMYGLTRTEVAALRRLSTPEKIQAYLDGIQYNLEPGGDTLRSPRRVLRDETAANIPTRYAPDGPDATTLATGDAGGRTACGVITRVAGDG